MKNIRVITIICAYLRTSLSNLWKTVVLCFILTFLFHASFHSFTVLADERHTVIVIQSQPIAAYGEAIKGFEEACKRNNISIDKIYDLKGDIDEGKRVIKNIKDNKLRPDLILAVGVLATTLVKEQFTDTPIIFCMVINHERFNLEGANMTGISSEASIGDQFGILKELLGTKRNVGVIYDPMKTGKIVSEADLVVKRIEFNLIKAEVESESEVSSALTGMVDKINALWIVPDSTVVTKGALEMILKAALKHRLPVFCTSSAIVKAGALVSISPDYRQTGLQAAHLAQTLLNSPTVISLGVKQPDKLKVTLNTQTAGIIRVDTSPLRSRPDVVFYP
ncbi:MAG: ABC transporter substrate binding protein [Candidatus Brocadiaceae bacterium]|uniref:ABC transporter substrate-binding protein n=1 Tax=Candidatus Wunengus sp. YC61 TaxID=3367698 RepID=UPI002725E31C|nr:ABC transporter substrate binding protein [Candidatus Brocadiaceae bacterium]